MIETFDKTDHTREYELRQKEHTERLVNCLKQYDDNGHRFDVIEDIKAEAIKEGKRLGKEELLKDLALATKEIEGKVTRIAQSASFRDEIDYEKGFYLLKTILTGE